MQWYAMIRHYKQFTHFSDFFDDGQHHKVSQIMRLLSTAHRGAEVQGKTAACYAYKLGVARLKLIAAPHKIAQERWVSVVPYCGYNGAYAQLYAVGVDAVAPRYLGAKLGGDAVQKVAVLHRYDYCAYKILVTE